MAGQHTPGGVPAGGRTWFRARFAQPNPHHTAPDPELARTRLHTTPVQHAATTLAAVFGLIGLLGFLPGPTSRLADLEFAGHDSGALLFGVFTVSVLHNVVHLLFAIAGLAFATTSGAARRFLAGGGVLYLLLALYGGLVAEHGAANFVPVNAADDWLHLGLGLVMIALSLLPAGRAPAPPAASRAPDAGQARG